MDNSNRNIMPGAGPFYFEGNDIGVLLLHGGGGGTAADLKPMAEFLHNEGGFTVRVPLLSGFGTTPEELKDTPISAWMEDLEVEYNFLKQKVKKIVVGGHSMGAIFSLYLGATKNPDAIFTISAPIGVKGILPKLLPLVKYFIKSYPLPIDEFEKETDGAWVGYDKFPLKAGTRLFKIIKEFKKYYPKITCPTLLIQGRLDGVIKTSSMDKIYGMINSKNKRKLWLENSDHPILKNPDEDLLFTEILKFIKEVTK